MSGDTKTCDLVVHLMAGVRLKGRFHTSPETASKMRPSDALREGGGFFALSDAVVVSEKGQTRNFPALLVNLQAVIYIELPGGWN